MTTSIPINTVQRVYELMEARNLNEYQLCRLSGISFSTIKNTEKRGGQLTVDTLYRLCEALGISMSDFFQ